MDLKGGKYLVSNSCCKAASTVMFSLVTGLSTVSSPSIDKSMKLSIGWKWALLEFYKNVTVSAKVVLYEISRNCFWTGLDKRNVVCLIF